MLQSNIKTLARSEENRQRFMKSKDSNNHAFKAVRDAVEGGTITLDEGNNIIIEKKKEESKQLFVKIRLS